jgi:hypothetical protein
MCPFGFHRVPSFRCFSRNLAAGVILLAVQMLPCAFAQTELATVLGRVTDPSGAVVAGAAVEVRNVDTNLAVMSGTNGDGLYAIPSLHPGHYVISVRKEGFKTVSVTQLHLNVQDNVVRNFVLEVGSSSESITVTAEGERMNTTDATVSTVVDRNFTENLPMNGRSFQTLIELTPGVALTVSTAADNGQFSVNGQRANSNYWMVDGVSANIGASGFVGGGGLAGAVGSFSAQGGTNSLVSIDAMQEFRIQTSTYAPEFGRTPGGQISILTRSGTNQFHGTVFDYLRNDALDANNWFANRARLPKPKERQNDFGGTLSGPLIKSRTFFFFSYEGLRLRLPETALTTVPDLNSRQSAAPAVQPYFNAYPVPNGPALGDGTAPFNATFTNRSTLDAYSIRIDHRLTKNVTFFGRYNQSPSTILGRGGDIYTLSELSPSSVSTQTATLGSTQLLSATLGNDLRFNYSRTHGRTSYFMDDFGGAVPLESAPFPVPFTPQNANFSFNIFSLTNEAVGVGKNDENAQHQVNVVDTLSLQKGAHSLKFGVDYRRLSPVLDPFLYAQGAFFLDVPSAQTGNVFFSDVFSFRNATLLFRNLGVYAEDTWRITPRLTMTYGLRWDVDFAPASLNGPNLPAVTSFNDFANLTLAPAGTPPFHTTYGNIAPRLGLAYQIRENANWQSVVRGGAGVFYDLATSETGNLIANASYPFAAFLFNFGGTFPLDAATAAPPPIVPPGGGSGEITAFYPHLQLPYTIHWNAAFEQSLGSQQVLTLSYVGAAGRRLLQSAELLYPSGNISATLVANKTTSSYNALQLQFKRRLSKGLQTVASYTWAHSIDDGSAGSFYNGSNLFVPSLSANVNRGPSDFDVRQAFTAGITYEIPAPKLNFATDAILHHWSLENVVQGRSALPLNVADGALSHFGNANTSVRPDVVAGQAFYLRGSQYPGDLALNPAAFTAPPTDTNGVPLRQGDLGRNALRGFGAAQWDLAIHRDFPLNESIKLQFRAEMFNLLNHPIFAPPVHDISDPQFGVSTQVLADYLGGSSVGAGGLSPLYQLGGPRSIQLALKLSF